MPSIPGSIALTNIADGASIVAADHRNNYAALQVAVNGLITAVNVTAKGDLLVGTGSAALVNVAVGANSKVVVADSTQTAGLKWDYPPGYEFAYNEFTAPVATTNTTEATAAAVATASAVTFDGATAVWIEFFSPDAGPNTASRTAIFALYDGASSIGIMGDVSMASANNGGGLMLKRRMTPAAATKTYSVRLYIGGGAGTVTAQAGLGGAGVYMPGYIRITKA